jgi:hypothetical protein
MPRQRRRTLRAAQRLRALEVSIAGLAALSLAGIAGLLAGLDSAGVAIATAVVSVAAGLLAYLVPLPPSAEVRRRTGREAF